MTEHIRRATDERDKGFTLIELLVVVIIVGILAAIAIPVFLNQRKKGVDAGIKADIKNAASAAETIAIDDPTGAVPAGGATPYYNRARFTAAGFKFSPGNDIAIKGSPSLGYCIAGTNPGATGGPATYQWYDSTIGGMQPGRFASGTSVGGVCAMPDTTTGGYVGLGTIG